MALFASRTEEYKLVILMRTDLDMGKGKIAAQAGHASVQCALAAQKRDRKGFDAWMDGGQKKVVLKVSSKDELTRYMAEARSRGVTTALITDAGRTQIEPGTVTCLGIGPAPESEIDRITGELKMLRSSPFLRVSRSSPAEGSPASPAGRA